jgi:hypothetical protein
MGSDRGADRPRIKVPQFSQCSPAVGTNAATEKQNFGTPRWQLTENLNVRASIVHI